MRFRFGEIDLLGAQRGKLVVFEVRGRASGARRPVEWITRAKCGRLFRLADSVSRRWNAPASVELVEVIGLPPRGSIGAWLAGAFPRLFGLGVRRVRLEPE